MHYIAAVQLKGFYVFHARQRHPEMGERPGCVTRDDRVLEPNSFAEAKGVSCGMSLRAARAILADGVFVAWEREHFAAEHADWLEGCLLYANEVETTDQHEAFVDLSGHPDPLSIVERLQATVTAQAGVECEVGLGPSKWIARLALGQTDQRIALTDPGRFVSGLPVAALLPLSPEHRQRLEFFGYRAIGDVAKTPYSALIGQFGLEAHTLALCCKGQLSDPVEPNYPECSLSDEIRFESPIDNAIALEHGVRLMSEHLGEALLEQDRSGNEARLVIEPDGEDPIARTRIFTKPIRCPESTAVALGLLLRPCVHQPIIALRAQLMRLRMGTGSQGELALPSLAGRVRERRLDRAFRVIRSVYGDRSIARASDLEVSRRTLVVREWRDHFDRY